MQAFSFSPIGVVFSCYKEKFGIPRQPGLVPSATAELVLNEQFSEESVRGLAGFSHLWLQFVFHANRGEKGEKGEKDRAAKEHSWKSMVRPPRLGGNKKIGVFASRSPFRPNPIGLSVVELIEIKVTQSRVVLHLGGCDLLDGTPILDIKPYLPYVDAVPNAKGGFAESAPQTGTEAELTVSFTQEAKQQCEQAEQRLGVVLFALITQLLQLDPRPSYQKDSHTVDSERIYAMKLYDFDLKWKYCDNREISVLGLTSDKLVR